MVVRLTAAAVVACLISAPLTNGSVDLAGALAALLVVQASAYSTITMSARPRRSSLSSSSWTLSHPDLPIPRGLQANGAWWHRDEPLPPHPLTSGDWPESRRSSAG